MLPHEALIGARTQLINHVRRAVKSFGAYLPECSSPSFHERVPEHMPVTLLPALEPLFESIAVLTTRIRSYTGRNCYRLGAL